MKTSGFCMLIFVVGLSSQALCEESETVPDSWYARFDLGGNIPQDPSLTLHDGPVTSGEKMELSAGAQFDFTLGYRLRRWLSLEGEMGVSYNEINRVGNWDYPNSSLNRLSLMFNAVVERPQGRLVPYAGIGGGGVFSTISFGNRDTYYYYYCDPDGEGTDFAPAAQAFAGLRYKLGEHSSLGVSYRFLVTGRQKWHVDWWDGNDFTVGADSFATHFISLGFSRSF